MGKRHRKNYTDALLSEEKEKERIRNSILKVFRARVNSPGGGGAILVGNDNTKTDHTRIDQKSDHHTSSQPESVHHTSSQPKSVHNSSQLKSDHHSSSQQNSDHHTSSQPKSDHNSSQLKSTNEPVTIYSSSMSDRDVSPNVKTARQKKHRHRVRSKTKHTKKLGRERSDITKHIRMVNDIRTNLQSSSNGSSRQFNVITQSRLTKKLGLFNQGRKSETISRDIPVPDAVRRKAQEDLKKILSHDDNDENRPRNIDLSLNSPLRASLIHSKTNTKQDIGYYSRGSNRSVVTPLSAHNRQAVSTGSTSCLSIASIESEDGCQAMSETPPYEETAEFLISALKPKRFFPGRNLFQETIEELQSIMRKNAPITATPISSRSAKLRAASDSVKRSLLDIFPPSASSTKSDSSVSADRKVCSKDSTEQAVNNMVISRLQKNTSSAHDKYPEQLLKNPHDVQCDRLHESNRQCEKPKDKFEKQYKLASSEKLYRTNKDTTKYESKDGIELSFNSEAEERDARSLLKCNDAAAVIVEMSNQNIGHQNEPMDIDIYNSDAMSIIKHNHKVSDCTNVSKNQSNDSTQCIVDMEAISGFLGNTNCVSPHITHSSQSSGYQGSQQASVQIQHQPVPSKEQIIKNHAVITELREHPEYMPTFHSGCYTTHDETHYNRMKSASTIEIESMDILDYLDHDTTDFLSNKMPGLIKSNTPDSDGSPLWLPPEPIIPPPAKPDFETLSPPMKLYPRRLY